LSSLPTLGKPLFSLVLLIAATRMILSGIYEVGGAGKTLEQVAGGHQREVLPLFRRGAAAHSFAGFEEQLERLEAEARIRQQL